MMVGEPLCSGSSHTSHELVHVAAKNWDESDPHVVWRRAGREILQSKHHPVPPLCSNDFGASNSTLAHERSQLQFQSGAMGTRSKT